MNEILVNLFVAVFIGLGLGMAATHIWGYRDAYENYQGAYKKTSRTIRTLKRILFDRFDRGAHH